jgi:glucose/arabinose dehydrogenase
VAVAALLLKLFWPERLAVNVPWRQAAFGMGIAPDAGHVLSRLRAADGLSVGRFADGLDGARFLRFTAAGDLLVSQPRAGVVTLLFRDQDGDGRSDGRRVLLKDLDQPHGLDFHDGWLYVAETGAVGRIRFDAATRSASGAFERVVKDLPKGGGHWTRTLRFGPDGLMYVSVGSNCNVCTETDRRRAAITRYRPDGSGEEIFARGLRNAVGFDFQPGTGDLYATDNGRDLLGDDFPPCELNRVVQGGFYGWPFANGNRVPDPDFGKGHEAEIAASIPPVHAFRAHNAPLGMTFVAGDAVPEDLRGAVLVALHGSWNRSRKDGYKVVSVRLGADGRSTEKDFLTGFLKGDDVIGRPVDVAQGPDAAFYVSDDYGGAIFRVAGQAAATSENDRTASPRAGPSLALADVPPSEVASRSARGRKLYDGSRCNSCHDTQNPPPGMQPKPLEALGARYDVASLAQFLKTPTPPMPAFPMTDDERRDLAVYLLTR